MSSILSAARDELLDLVHGDSPAHTHLRGRLALLLVCTVALDVIGTVVALLAERHAHGTGITSLGTAAFWSTTQLLTVSSSLPNPLTTAGRVLDVVLEAWAITGVGALAGSFGAFFHRRSLERAPMGGGPPG